MDTTAFEAPVEDAPPASSARSWLYLSELDRTRLLDMHDRVRTSRRVQGASLGIASVVRRSGTAGRS